MCLGNHDIEGISNILVAYCIFSAANELLKVSDAYCIFSVGNKLLKVSDFFVQETLYKEIFTLNFTKCNCVYLTSKSANFYIDVLV